jgi:spore coat protein U-like protein
VALCAPAARAQNTCTFTTGPTPLQFAPYNPAAATPNDSTATFVFECNRANIRPTVQLSAGAGTFAQRQMTMGGEALLYNLYSNAGRTTIWGDGTPPSSALTNTRRRTTYTIYGRIPVAQWTSPGDFTDTITITLLY